MTPRADSLLRRSMGVFSGIVGLISGTVSAISLLVSKSRKLEAAKLQNLEYSSVLQLQQEAGLSRDSLPVAPREMGLVALRGRVTPENHERMFYVDGHEGAVVHTQTVSRCWCGGVVLTLCIGVLPYHPPHYACPLCGIWQTEHAILIKTDPKTGGQKQEKEHIRTTRKSVPYGIHDGTGSEKDLRGAPLPP
jgi:hypothetical protein